MKVAPQSPLGENPGYATDTREGTDNLKMIHSAAKI